MRIIKHIIPYTVSVFLMAVSAGCAKEDFGAEGLAYLEIGSVSVGKPSLKSMIEGPAFPASEAAKGIGLFLFDAAGGDYDGKACHNIRYSNGKTLWTAEKPIMLSGTSGTLYGYFPYDSSVTDIREIPVESSLDGTDYMYADPVADVCISKRTVALSLRHALARISLKFVKDGTFPGEGKISSISLSGGSVAESGTMDATDGSIAADAGTVTFTLPCEDRITEQGTVEECLIVPASSASASGLKMTCIIDSQEFTLPLEGIDIKKGVHSSVTINVSNIGLCIRENTSGEESTDVISVRTAQGRNVTIRLSQETIENDIIMGAYPDGDDVVIDAMSLSGMPLTVFVPYRKCSHTDGMDINSRYLESRITGITEDIGITVGYDAVKMARTDVPNTAFYKDIFLDAGVSLDRCSSIPRGLMNIYGLTSNSLMNSDNWEHIEFFNFSDSTFTKQQIEMIAGCETDRNGILLYPDGNPRFRLVYGYGGKASKHAASLTEAGCKAVNRFYTNGGCFVSSCASTVLTAAKYGSSTQALSYDFLDGGATVFSGMYISNIRYYNDIDLTPGTDFQTYCNGIDRLDSLVHNGGSMLDEATAPSGAEVLARFATKAYPLEALDPLSSPSKCVGKPCIWAYKRNDRSGRFVACGSHPEVCNTENVTNLYSAEFLYALDGQGCATASATLQNGITHTMDLSEGDPSHCGIGDGQCQHFVIYFPKPVAKLDVNLDWDSSARLDLAVRHGSFAFPDGEVDKCEMSSAEDAFFSPSLEIHTESIPAGMYYICVRCNTKPSCNCIREKSTSYYFVYGGSGDQLKTLNGIPYNIKAKWSYKQED